MPSLGQTQRAPRRPIPASVASRARIPTMRQLGKPRRLVLFFFYFLTAVQNLGRPSAARSPVLLMGLDIELWATNGFPVFQDCGTL